jgi:dipeptidyl aminopeptidase/acylaminoacyl peptidase
MNRSFRSVCLFAPLFLNLVAQETLAHSAQDVGHDALTNLVTAHDVASLKEIQQLSLSPDKSKAIFLLVTPDYRSNTYSLDWTLFDIENRRILNQIKNASDPVFVMNQDGSPNGNFINHRAKWSPNGDWIAFIKSVDGHEEIWRTNAIGNNGEKLFRSKDAITEFNWYDDGKRILFKTTGTLARTRAALAKSDTAGQMYDVSKKALDLVPLSAFRKNILFPPAAEAPAYFTIDAQNKTMRHESSADSATLGLNMSSSNVLYPEKFLRKQISEDGGWIAGFENADPSKYIGPNPLYSIVIRSLEASSRSLKCDDDSCASISLISDTKVWWRPDGKVLYFFRQLGLSGTSRGLYEWNVDDDIVRPILVTDDYLSDCEFATDSFICFSESVDKPRSLVSINISSGLQTILHNPNPEFSRKRVGEVRKIQWVDNHGRQILSHLVLPPELQPGQRLPLIIVQYRYFGFLKGGVGDEYPIHALSSNGFAVLNYDMPFDHLGMATKPDYYEEYVAGYVEERRKDISAFEAIISKLSKDGIVDANRVGITGLSAGNDNIHVALAVEPELFAAVSSSGGGWAPSNFHLLSKELQDANARRGLGFPGSPSGSNWSKISPIIDGTSQLPPILFQAADAEFIYDLANFSALRQYQSPSELVVFIDEHHVKWQPAHRLEIYERNIDWFRFWLKGEENLSAEKSAQYERWNTMRAEKCSKQVQPLPSYCRYSQEQLN